ncbi:MAG: MFS transporter [Pseudomonadota bacterium]
MSIFNALVLSRRPAAAFVVIGVFWGCFAAYVPVLKAQLGASDALFGTLLLGSATGLVSAMWLAPYVDRVLGARGMQAGALFLALAWVVPGHMTTPIFFALGMAFVGLGSGVLDVIMNARVSELEAEHHQPLMNANHGMFSVAYAAGALVAGTTREAGIGPGPVFAAIGLVPLCLLPFLRMPVAAVPEASGVEARYPLVPIAICGGIVLVAFMSEATVEAWSALHVERTLGGGAAEGALGPAMLGITMAIGRFSGQAIVARLAELPVVMAATFLSAIGAVLAALAPTPAFAYLGFGILGLGVSVIGPIGLALVGKLVPPYLRTEAISRTAVIGFSGFFFAPMLMGLVSEAFGLRFAFLCVAGLLMLTLPLALQVRKLPSRNG